MINVGILVTLVTILFCFAVFSGKCMDQDPDDPIYRLPDDELPPPERIIKH